MKAELNFESYRVDDPFLDLSEDDKLYFIESNNGDVLSPELPPDKMLRFAKQNLGIKAGSLEELAEIFKEIGEISLHSKILPEREKELEEMYEENVRATAKKFREDVFAYFEITEANINIAGYNKALEISLRLAGKGRYKSAFLIFKEIKELVTL